jgi:hypothetical protein
MKIAGLFSGESPMSLALTTTYENGFSLLCHQAEGETHSKGLGVSSLFTWCRAPGEEGFSTEYPNGFAMHDGDTSIFQAFGHKEETS